jgi:hypothetical protein
MRLLRRCPDSLLRNSWRRNLHRWEICGRHTATISLVSGTHQITIKSTGKKDWSREIEAMKGSQVTLRAVSAQSP